MADISGKAAAPRTQKTTTPPGVSKRRPEPAPADPLWLVEAFFFAYRDFIAEPDLVLSKLGFGRAHHRVLYFVARYPGMRVADLLEILRITKQSLARVLRELVREGCIRQHPGKTDRRERLLYATEKGTALAGQLTQLQTARIADALAALGPGGAQALAIFFKRMAPDIGRMAVFAESRLAQKNTARKA